MNAHEVNSEFIDVERLNRIVRAYASADLFSIGQLVDELRTDERGPDASILLISALAQMLIAQLLEKMSRDALMGAIDSEIIRLLSIFNDIE